MSKPIPILICMRNRLVRDGICHILRSENYNVRASVGTIDEALHLKIPSRTDLIIIYCGDSQPCHNTNAIMEFKKRYPGSFVVLLLEDRQHEQRWQVERLGIAGVLLQSISSEVFIASLKLVALGEHVFSVPISIDTDERSTVLVERPEGSSGQIVMLPAREDEISPAPHDESTSLKMLARQPKLTRRSELSERELQFLSCLVAGNSNKVTARMCNITESTVKVHLKAILRKTEVVNRTQAAVWALNNMDFNGFASDMHANSHE